MDRGLPHQLVMSSAPRRGYVRYDANDAHSESSAGPGVGGPSVTSWPPEGPGPPRVLPAVRAPCRGQCCCVRPAGRCRAPCCAVALEPARRGVSCLRAPWRRSGFQFGVAPCCRRRVFRVGRRRRRGRAPESLGAAGLWPGAAPSLFGTWKSPIPCPRFEHGNVEYALK